VAGAAGVAAVALAGLFAGAAGALVVCATALPATNTPAISIVTNLLMVSSSSSWMTQMTCVESNNGTLVGALTIHEEL
jgi:hypothetical protein